MADKLRRAVRVKNMKSRTALRLLPSSTDTQVSACVHVATGSITGNRAGRWRGGRATLSRQTLLQTDYGIVPVFGDFRLFCINIEDCFVIRKELWILSIERKQTQYLLAKTMERSSEVSDTDTNGWSWSPSATKLSCAFPRGWSWSPVAGRESGEQPNCWSWSPYLRLTRQKLRTKWSWSPHTIDMPTQVAAFKVLRRSLPANRMKCFKLPKHCGEERPPHGNMSVRRNGSRGLCVHVPCDGDDVHDFASVTGLHPTREGEICHNPSLLFTELNLQTCEDGLSKDTDELSVSSDYGVLQTSTDSLQKFENKVKMEMANEEISCTSDPSPNAEDGNESFVGDGTPPDGTDLSSPLPPVLAATTPLAGGSEIVQGKLVGDDASAPSTTDVTDGRTNNQNNMLGQIINPKDSDSDVKQSLCSITEINVNCNYSSRLINSESSMNAEAHCHESSSNRCNKIGKANFCVNKDKISINADIPTAISVICEVSRKCRVNANTDSENNLTEAISTESAEGSVLFVNTVNNTEEFGDSLDTENTKETEYGESAIDNESDKARKTIDKTVSDEDTDLSALNATDNTAGETLVEMLEENETVVGEHKALGHPLSLTGDGEMQVDKLITNVSEQVDVSYDVSPPDDFEEPGNEHLQMVNDEVSKKLINTATDEATVHDILPTENSVKQAAIDRSSEIAEDDARSRSLITSSMMDIPVNGGSEDDPDDLSKDECGLDVSVPSTVEHCFADQREKFPLSPNENSTNKTNEDSDILTHGTIDTIATQRTINVHSDVASETAMLCSLLVDKTHDIEPTCQAPVDSLRMSYEIENREINHKISTRLRDVPLKDTGKSMEIKNVDNALFSIISEMVESNPGLPEDYAHPANQIKGKNKFVSVVCNNKHANEGTFDNCLPKPASAFGEHGFSDFANNTKVSDMSQEPNAVTFQSLSDVFAMKGKCSSGSNFPILASQLSSAANGRESHNPTLHDEHSTPSENSFDISESSKRFLDLEEQTWNPKSVLNIRYISSKDEPLMPNTICITSPTEVESSSALIREVRSKSGSPTDVRSRSALRTEIRSRSASPTEVGSRSASPTEVWSQDCITKRS
ncbi:uncharacterized protein LOC119573448 [Penaeus monodon]|uniref:uncharacterized protein LOC119573448 n=1 Tax=Penaeus monodon TaxID=6687 RepID=UPI0018A7155C|nr:uncharacterized protein LOC119573448 [Penaeus monodon]